MKLTVLDNPSPVLGGFGKGIKGSRSLNFATSGGINCDPQCPYIDGDCYAIRLERRNDRTQLLAKLQRHENSAPEDVADRALAELAKLSSVPWLRVSTDGSVPNNPTRSFGRSLRALLAYARDNSVPVHFPAETARKAARYRRLVGALAVVRESAVSLSRFMRARHAVSVVVGNWAQSPRERLALAFGVARERFERSGRKTKVCPAIAAQTTRRNQPTSAHCGNCTLCAESDVDIVYPLHK